jgi:hypothetical protein
VRGLFLPREATVKKELALRIVHLNELIAEQKGSLAILKETIKSLEETRETYLRDLVRLVTEGEDDA